MPVIANDMQWETIAVPITGGVDLNTRARLIDPANLAVADNVYYSKSGGPEKRRGHRAVGLYNAFITYPDSSPPSQNLYGYGLIDMDDYVDPKNTTSIYPQAGDIKDIVVYEDKEIAWDGWRFFEPIEVEQSGKSRVVTAVLPTFKSYQTANTQNPQDYACACENDTIRTVGYIETVGATSTAYAKVYDVVTGSLKFTATLNHGSSDPVWVRTVSCGGYCHVLVSDSTDEKVYCYTIHQSGTAVVKITEVLTVDAVVGSVFDVWKYDETKFLVAGVDTDIRLTWMNHNGTVNSTSIPPNTLITVVGSPVDVAVAVHPYYNLISLFYNDSGTSLKFATLSETGVIQSAGTVATTNTNYRIAVAPSYVNQYFHYFWDTNSTPAPAVNIKTIEGTTTISTKTAYNMFLASKACRVGNKPFVWAIGRESLVDSSYQTTRYLLDADLLPVARNEYGTAGANYTSRWLSGMNFITSEDGSWNNTKFHGALLYNERIDNEVAGDGTTYSHKAIKFYELNFVPDKLSYDQAGKVVYIAGGQLWAYDGDTLHEASFGTGVSNISVSSDALGGSLTIGGKYRWRIDVCYKNAQNEECRAISFLTDEVTMPAADTEAILEFHEVPTRITDAYYLIFRNESEGTVWYLVSSRINPVKYANTGTVTFTDTTADTALLDKEQHPANATGYLQPIAAPACELITFGQNRLWVAGGELLPGEVWPSRLFSPGQTPAFHWALAFQTDKTVEPVTALAFQSDYGIVFKEGSTFIITGDVSPNIYQPVQPRVQLALADRGCINFKSVGRLYNAISFQSANGYKVISAAGQMEDIGFPVESVRGNCIGAVLVKLDEHIRFYQSDEKSLVFDYRDKVWTTFSFNTKPTAAVYSNRTGLAVLARGNQLLYEDNDMYTDGGFDYHYTIKTAPLAKQIGGFQRVRRVYCMGEKEGVPPPVTMRIYQDCHSWWTAQVKWDYSDDLNIDPIGSGWPTILTAIGTGFIGNPSAAFPPIGNNTDPELGEFKDDIWKFRYRIGGRKQKCENIAIELTDKGRINENKWIPVAFALEIGTKKGLDRTSARTITEE